MPNFEKPPQKELPVGKAKELSRFTQKHWREHLVLFSEVKNRVLEVNPNVYFPLKMEEGKPSPLGLFAEAAFQEKPPKELPEGKRILETWPEHQRSALLGRALFADKEGRIYRDIDLKGAGHIIAFESAQKVREPGRLSVRHARGKAGLLNEDAASFDYQMSEDFLKAGIRTHRVLGTIALEEIVVNGEKLSLEEARERGFINEDSRPVVEVRAFGTKARIQELKTENTTQENLLLKDAKRLIGQELGRKKSLSNEEYLEWFAKTLGRNIGLMHKNGWYHKYLTGHNITLDCRIVDLDSINELVEREQLIKDRDFGGGSVIGSLSKRLFLQETTYLKLFQKSYDAVFPPKARRLYFLK